MLASDLMIALLDGLTIDAGVASEIGGLCERHPSDRLILILDSKAEPTRKIAALQETAENQFHYLNLYNRFDQIERKSGFFRN